MIKKLGILALLLITGFSFNGLKTIKATVGPDIIWTVVNTHSTYYILFGSVDVPVMTDTVIFYIPETIYSSVNIGGGNTSKIEIYDDDNVYITELDWYDTFGNQISGTFDLDLSEFGIDVDEPIYMKFAINQTFEVAPSSNYVDYVEDYATIEFLYFNPDYRDYYFKRYESTYYQTVISNDIVIPYNSHSIALDMRDITNYHIKYDGTYSSYIRLYDKNDVTLDYLYLADYVFLESDYIIIDIPYDTYDLNDATYMVLSLIVEDNNMDYLDSVNRNIIMDFNKDINMVYFMSQATLLSTSVLMDFGGIPTEPTAPTPPTGFEFTGWFLENGEIYNFTHLSSDMFTDNSISIYAYFRVSGTASDYDTIDATPDTGTNIFNVLSAFGFDTDVGFIIIYLVAVLIVSVALVYYNVSGFVVLIVTLLVTGLFIYLGFLPLYVIALVFIALVVGILFYMGGVNSE